MTEQETEQEPEQTPLRRRKRRERDDDSSFVFVGTFVPWLLLFTFEISAKNKAVEVVRWVALWAAATVVAWLIFR